MVTPTTLLRIGPGNLESVEKQGLCNNGCTPFSISGMVGSTEIEEWSNRDWKINQRDRSCDMLRLDGETKTYQEVRNISREVKSKLPQGCDLQRGMALRFKHKEEDDSNGAPQGISEGDFAVFCLEDEDSEAIDMRGLPEVLVVNFAYPD